MTRMIAGALLACVTLACDTGPRRAGGGSPRGVPPPPTGGGGQGERSPDDRPVVLFFGTSLTAGLGLEPEETYPALVRRMIDSAGLRYRAVAAGVSGETSAAALRRIDWLLSRCAPLESSPLVPVPLTGEGEPGGGGTACPVAVLVLEQGANDALRGQDLAAARANLQQIIDRTRARYPDVRLVVAGMEAPPNLGARYTREFHDLFVRLARDNGAALIPFLLEGVGGVAELNQPDGIHPNAAGARVVARNVWRVLEPVLRAR